MSNNERIDPFVDLSDFSTKPKRKSETLQQSQIEAIALENNFPSRQPIKPGTVLTGEGIRRRYTTGRNQQINIKAKAETITRLYQFADSKNIPLGEVLERALDALERQEKTK